MILLPLQNKYRKNLNELSIAYDSLSDYKLRDEYSRIVRFYENVYTDKLIVLLIRSYNIDKTYNLLDHIYLQYKNVEIHPGMAKYGKLAFTPHNEFGFGKTDGLMLMCPNCFEKLLTDMENRSDMFNIFFNNCDIIIPFRYQTPLIWISSLLLLTSLAILIIDADNWFAHMLMVPFFTTLLLVLLKKIDCHRNEILYSCEHLVDSK